MTCSIRPLYPLSCPLKQSSSSTPWIIHSKPYSNSQFSSLESSHQRLVAASVSFNPSGNLDLSLYDEEGTEVAAPPMPPSEGRYEVVIDNDVITRLDLSPFHKATGLTSPKTDTPTRVKCKIARIRTADWLLRRLISAKAKEFLERTIGFTINYTREDEHDPRELSEFPDIRLWFVRLDAMYPWLPVLLDWRAGELARYAAMLVPHQMSMRMGVVFNPEAMELFVMQKVFVVYSWLKENDIPMPRLKVKDMARMLGYGIGDDLFDLVDKQQNQK